MTGVQTCALPICRARLDELAVVRGPGLRAFPKWEFLNPEVLVSRFVVPLLRLLVLLPSGDLLLSRLTDGIVVRFVSGGLIIQKLFI